MGFEPTNLPLTMRVLYQLSYGGTKMEPGAGIEPATYALRVRRSGLLSYPDK